MNVFPMLKTALLSILCMCSLLAQEKKLRHAPLSSKSGNETPKCIHIYCELIEISSVQFSELMTTSVTGPNHSTLRNELLRKIKKGDAKLISNQSILTKSGERATNESINEFIFSSEYEPSSFERFEKKPHPYGSIYDRYKNSTFQPYPIPPVAFETRLIGTILEIEAKLDENQKSIHLVFRPEIVKHISDCTYTTWNTSSGKIADKQPLFYTLRTNTSTSLPNNQFSLVSTHSPELDGEPDETRKWLYFIKASILEVTK